MRTSACWRGAAVMFHEQVAANVRAEMARRRLTQADIARVIGTGQPQVSSRLTGKVPFTINELAELAVEFGVPIADLIGDGPHRP